nr:hypothetical protein [Escherichia coli]
MQSQGVGNAPEEVANLKGDAARAQFVNLFKEVQRLNTQLDHTDLRMSRRRRSPRLRHPIRCKASGMYRKRQASEGTAGSRPDPA